jgi:hypothetical protein
MTTICQRSIRLSTILVLGLLASSAPAAEKSGLYHPSHIHHALHELRLARHEIREANHDFGGHRVVALRATDDAIRHLEALVNHPHHRQHSANLKSHPNDHHRHTSHIHHALHELRLARVELHESRYDFGGQKAIALADIDIAIEQLAHIVRHYRK